ncbi:hypothetical protein VMCG_10712 [Cytospora schulzeri]|uniref:NDT80 domain-containing protein n=1 Tax=Cytospora schulzeri TaxID=448051 RepID=A0A423V9B6_9PEZI|nr:hypothetical protein VMCG_10712 [Valsa malicola]
MAKPDGDLDPLWQDLDWAIGQMLLMGWDGTEVTPQIRTLIEDHHLGSIILTAKNLKSAQQTAELVQELQTIAHQSGHPYPLLIAVDQENGGVNSLFDEDYICQFPSAMGIAATGSLDMAYNVAKATATEISAVGVNLILGPVLDVLTNARYQPMSVRASGDDPQEVSQYSIAAINGYKDAGLATCGKHFPTYGNLDFRGSSLDVPIITQTLEELGLSALVPYRNTIATGNLDAVFIGGCGIASANMNVSHACLSDQVVDDLLRQELGFKGVAISECLEMEALYQEIGVKGGTVMAVEAGCDLILLCKDYNIQLEGIAGLKLGIENGIISRNRIMTSLRRILRLKSSCTSWAKALNPPGIPALSLMHPSHLTLSRQAYDSSITVMRDRDRLLPLSQTMDQEEELLLLTPLVKPLPASAATKAIESKRGKDSASTIHDRWTHRDRGAIMSGEGVFREFGRALARARNGKLLHTSYTANGVRPVHENLINRASGIILVTADANRNLYQSGFTKHVAMMCSMLRATGQKKSLVVVAVSSPYDFAMDKSIGTYVCTFDFTETAMQALVRALFGEFTPQGSLPGTLRKSKKVLKSRQQWLVENYERGRDARPLDDLIHALARASTPNLEFLKTTTASSFELYNARVEESHFVVRNSSTKALYGFCATYHTKGIGILGSLFVDPAKRNVSIGRSLHRRALRHLTQKRGVKKIQLGVSFPGVFLGIPVVFDDSSNSNNSNSGTGGTGGGGSSSSSGTTSLRSWFANSGWDLQFPRRLTNMVITDLGGWSVPEGLLQSISRAGISFDLIHGLDNGDNVLDHVRRHAGAEALELYRFALQELKTCGVVRAKNGAGKILGSVIICSPGSSLPHFIPCLQSSLSSSSSLQGGGGAGGGGGGGGLVGGIVAPLVEPTAQATLVLQGLAVMGVRQNKAHGTARSVLSWVTDESHEPLLAMGFQVLQAFEEVTNSPENNLKLPCRPSHGDKSNNAMATFNSGHAGPPNHNTHGLSMPANMSNGAVDMGVGVFDQDLNFDESLLEGVNGLAPLPFTPSYEFESFNTFEDPFSSSSSYSAARPPYDMPAEAEPFNAESPSSHELDNKLLGFSAPIPKARLVDGAGGLADTNMTAELYGMFFVAEDVFGGENTGRPLELTCYRRNLWQCSGQITLPRHIDHVIDEQGNQVQVFDLAASITAIESIEGKPTEIISIPWKSSLEGVEGTGTGAGAGTGTGGGAAHHSSSSRSPAAPPNIALDLSAGQELDHHQRVSLPVSWKRLQFKHATANNGRRKGLQQHYVVQISLLGKTKGGEFIKIAEIQSGPVIVRGRSPRNFDSRKDVPLAGDKKAERRATLTSSSSNTPGGGGADSAPTPKSERGGDLAHNIQKYHSLGNVQQSSDWTTTSTPPPSISSSHSYGQQGPHPSKKLAVSSPNLNRPPVPPWSSEPSMSKPGGHQQQHQHQHQHQSQQHQHQQPSTPRSNSFHRGTTASSLPINLSLSEDERSPNRSNSDSTSPHFAKMVPLAVAHAQKSSEEDEEQLYEYFPLSLDDWQPPVDAIYRPHVVHHVFVPPELKAQQVRSRTKRYFSSD